MGRHYGCSSTISGVDTAGLVFVGKHPKLSVYRCEACGLLTGSRRPTCDGGPRRRGRATKKEAPRTRTAMEANDEEVMTIHCKLDGEHIQLSRDAASRAEALRDMMEDTESNVLPVELAAPPVCLVAAMLKHDAAVAAGADGEATFSLADVAPEALVDAMEAAHHLLASEAFAALVRGALPPHGGAGRGGTAPDARRE